MKTDRWTGWLYLDSHWQAICTCPDVFQASSQLLKHPESRGPADTRGITGGAPPTGEPRMKTREGGR